MTLVPEHFDASRNRGEYFRRLHRPTHTELSLVSGLPLPSPELAARIAESQARQAKTAGQEPSPGMCTTDEQEGA